MPVIIFIGVLFGFSGFAYGSDQQSARKREQVLFRDSLAQLQVDLFSKEAELEGLRIRLGEKNHQVLILAEKVNQLRGQINAMNSRAA